MKRAIAMGSAIVLAAVALWVLWHFVLASDNPRMIEAANGHAYQFVAAPDIRWDQARAAAAKLSWRGRSGYLATIDSAAEYQLVLDRVFSHDYPDVIYLGG